MSLAQLRHHFGVSRDTMADWLWGLPTPEWTQRPNAKDELRAQAIELRRSGWTVPNIATRLGVSKSSAYMWTRHLPLDPTPERARDRRLSVLRSRPQYWRVEGIMRGIIRGMRLGGDATM